MPASPEDGAASAPEGGLLQACAAAQQGPDDEAAGQAQPGDSAAREHPHLHEAAVGHREAVRGELAQAHDQLPQPQDCKHSRRTARGRRREGKITPASARWLANICNSRIYIMLMLLLSIQ